MKKSDNSDDQQNQLFKADGSPNYVPPEADFNGSDYSPAIDNKRLRGQLLRIFELMKDGKWRTLNEIEAGTGDPAASISAQLRHLRKKRYGSHTLNKQPRGERAHGLYEYSLIVNLPPEFQAA